jgi:hypothetical protein
MTSHTPKCKQCGAPGVRDEQFDVYGCAACDIWIERKCEDRDCRYCQNVKAIRRGSHFTDGNPATPWHSSGRTT